MRWSRAILLFPLGLLWGFIAFLKRKWYQFFKLSKRPAIATWVIGNIHAGGQGKTPTIIALYHWLNLVNDIPLKIAVLSRGYGRKSSGFRQVSYSETAITVGDEPLEIFYAINPNNAIVQSTTTKIDLEETLLQQPTNIHSPVFVCENRFDGIQSIQQQNPNISLVLLDDGFQHLNISASGNIILTKFQEPFSKDLPLPAGNLREFPSASKKADIILVTHSPKNLSIDEASKWKAMFYRQMSFWGLRATSARWFNSIYFASYSTSTPVKQSTLNHYSPEGNQLTKGIGVILITGVASASGIVDSLKDYFISYHFEYPDHHSFSIDDFKNWSKKYYQLKETIVHNSISVNEKVNEFAFVCTRKDYMRIMSICNEINFKNKSEKTHITDMMIETENANEHLYFNTSQIADLPFYVCHAEIEILFDEKTRFLNQILNHRTND